MAGLDAKARKPAPVRDAETGFVVTDVDFKPIYANSAAVSVLSFAPGAPAGAASAAAIQERMRVILRMERFSPGAAPANFFSGRRRYVCHPVTLESIAPASSRRTVAAFLLERFSQGPITTPGFAERYRLSPRERETCEYLKRGLKTREIAERMQVSPNTIKQFIRAVGDKVGASTRSGIVGKVMSRT
jgi:DNA-binding NarL/FixJ family response regulator